jgi:predicted dehydrogenase
MQTYRAALVGCSRMGAFIDNEVAGRSTSTLPYSHAAGYEACDRTDLIAGADMRPDVLEQFGLRYNVSPEHQYLDYKEMIVNEKPDIVSIATQPQHRAEIALFAIEHGVRAIYAEKALCASVQEAAALAEAVEKNGVAFNMGTNRRWHPGFAEMREAIASGEYGELKSVNTYLRSTLFNTHSHWIDTLMFLNGDAKPLWVQSYLPEGDNDLDGDRVINDSYGELTVGFENGVTAHFLSTPGPHVHEAQLEKAVITAAADSLFEVWNRTRPEGQTSSAPAKTIEYTPASSTLRLIQDLVQSLDTGNSTKGGIRVAETNTQIIFGAIESHRRNGARVDLPLTDSPLYFSPVNTAPKQPKYAVVQ